LKANAFPYNVKATSDKDNKQWAGSRNFIIAMAALDMFFVKFPKNVYSEAKIGTLITRFKDCVALVELDYIRNIIAWTMPKIAKWFWFKNLNDDLDRTNKPGQEFDQVLNMNISWHNWFVLRDLSMSLKKANSNKERTKRTKMAHGTQG
jgi:hypothetical protein